MSLADTLAAGTPALHLGGAAHWNALHGTLRAIEARTRPEFVTIETGSGASTILLAAIARDHTSISPSAEEHAAVLRHCATLGISTDHLRFVARPSELALPELPLDARYDLAFIDGRHAFPTPVVDFAYLEPRLVTDGILVLDDIHIPSVRVVFDFCRSSSEWEIEEFADDRAVVLRKLGSAPPGDPWPVQPYNKRFPVFSHLPLARRLQLTATDRIRGVGRRLKSSRSRR